MSIRTFSSGATRNPEEGKLDFEGFLAPIVIEEFAKYMHTKRNTPAGYREADNWQKGIPTEAYMKSMWRHFFEVWKYHRGIPVADIKEELMALLFNVQGMAFEVLNDRIGKTSTEGQEETTQKKPCSCGAAGATKVADSKRPCDTEIQTANYTIRPGEKFTYPKEVHSYHHGV